MKEHIRIIPLEKLNENLQELPWLETIQAQLSARAAPWETTIQYESVEYHIIVQRGSLVIVEPRLPDEPEFYNLRSLQQRVQRELRNHMDGLAHNLRGPISNIRSRSELMLEFMEMEPVLLASPLGEKIQTAFSRFLEASDQINSQLQDLERCFRWLDPQASPEPIPIREAFQTLHHCLMTDLSYKRNIQCEMHVAEGIPLWTGPAHLLLEPLLYLLRHTTHALLQTGKGIVLVSADLDNEKLVLTVSGDKPGKPIPNLTRQWNSLTEDNIHDTDNLVRLASWILADAGATLEQATVVDTPAFRVSYPVNHD